jgi:hypothetical protein
MDRGVKSWLALENLGAESVEVFQVCAPSALALRPCCPLSPSLQNLNSEALLWWPCVCHDHNPKNKDFLRSADHARSSRQNCTAAISGQQSDAPVLKNSMF